MLGYDAYRHDWHECLASNTYCKIVEHGLGQV